MKNFGQFIIFVLLLLGAGCANITTNDTPKIFTDNDIKNIEMVSPALAKMQHVVIDLSKEDIDYAMKYQDHFIQVLKLANIKSVVIKWKTIKKYRQSKIIDFINLLDSKAVEVLYDINFDEVVYNFRSDMTADQERELIEDLENNIAHINNFFALLEDDFKVKSFVLTTKMLSINDLNNQVKKGSLLSLYYNNGYGVDKDNEISYNHAVDQLKFWRKIFPLEKIIWRIDEQSLPKGLTAKVLDERLSFELLDFIDLLFVVTSSQNVENKALSYSNCTNVLNVMVTAFDVSGFENWRQLSVGINNIYNLNNNVVGFGGVYLINYGNFYNLWRNLK